MLLAKKIGGVTQAHKGKRYTWKKDGDAIEVPDDFGLELLAIRAGGFYVPEAPAVTEPAPAAKTAVTEPAPKAAAPVTEGKPAAK